MAIMMCFEACMQPCKVAFPQSVAEYGDTQSVHHVGVKAPQQTTRDARLPITFSHCRFARGRNLR
ncbi:hypothetical protein CBOM_07495 [Ceraceosorus bombacis]|uniref:Uncharacterized protein n=1 Tax=Ceraceosorus bombacis TaxID=401625 RepID=A0A0P1BEJ9_9BASI|nr:hypothetical protein CBOM_07495 [Ceraceosorus bombacis]